MGDRTATTIDGSWDDGRMGTYVVLLVMVLLVGLAVLGGLYFLLSRDRIRR
ncbi:hypothetical protein FraQA3DRAFT_2937 [Frankia sp. QA3]|nr:hypothetical protein FraQA3DRAFT_2937 [Frankia sp. QA3]